MFYWIYKKKALACHFFLYTLLKSNQFCMNVFRNGQRSFGRWMQTSLRATTSRTLTCRTCWTVRPISRWKSSPTWVVSGTSAPSSRSPPSRASRWANGKTRWTRTPIVLILSRWSMIHPPDFKNAPYGNRQSLHVVYFNIFKQLYI